MAREREGGNKNHTNGIQYEEEARTQTIKELKNQVMDDLRHYIDGGTLYRHRAPKAIDMRPSGSGDTTLLLRATVRNQALL